MSIHTDTRLWFMENEAEFYIGLSYGTDFWGVMDETTSGTFNLGLGFVF